MQTTTTTTTGTNTGSIGKTYSSYWDDWYKLYPPQQGWECPRCGRVNAPWIQHCDCSRDKWSITWTSDHTEVGDKPAWWKEVTCGDKCPDNVMNNPISYKIETQDTTTVGGSDYWNSRTKTWSNASGSDSNHADPNTTTYVWNCHTPHYSTQTYSNDLWEKH